MKKALFYLIMFLFVQVTVTALFAVGLHIAGAGKMTPFWTAISTCVSSLLAIILFAWRRWTPVTRRYMRTRPWAVLFWSAIAACGAILPSAGLQELLPDLPNFAEDAFTQLMSTRWGYFALGLFAPIAEEFVFRGAILRSLLQGNMKPWTAIAVSALIFALAHFNPAQLPHALLIGMLLGWMYWRTGSIIPGITYHWVNNTIAYVVSNLYPGADTDHLSDFFGGNTSYMLLSILFSLCILLPALFQLQLRMKK